MVVAPKPISSAIRDSSGAIEVTAVRSDAAKVRIATTTMTRPDSIDLAGARFDGATSGHVAAGRGSLTNIVGYQFVE
ncbi:hypothetical protein GCM10010528_24210 [Gordonia defluvii]|uniref:Uncharacterized protein n=1 Tax=Gordonia defluvii TaxID=283718 RepID=A0ABP6LHX7_9ACTN